MGDTVAVLYIDPRGPYPRMEGVDCWDEVRDARKYEGPYPIVAHPPCGPWCGLRHLYRGAEHDCGPRAVEQVQRFGGVLEQPAKSKLWERCSLPMSSVSVDDHGGFAVEVEQVAWGHVCRKKTWLYFVGVDRGLVVRGIRSGGRVTHWCGGGRSVRTGGSMPDGIKAASSQQKRRTPPAFAEWLVSLARTATR